MKVCISEGNKVNGKVVSQLVYSNDPHVDYGRVYPNEDGTFAIIQGELPSTDLPLGRFPTTREAAEELAVRAGVTNFEVVG